MSAGNGYANGTIKVVDPEQPHVAETHAVIKETVYHRETDIDYLLGLIRNQRKTGTLRIDISQGTVNAIRLEERQKLPGGS